MPGTQRHRLTATNNAPGLARMLVGRQLAASYTAEQREVAQLLISELVTNAVRHTHSAEITIDIDTDDRDRIRVSITDESAVTPQQHAPAMDEPTGRGLWIVEQLAERWGIDSVSGNGKCVWFELSCPSRRDISLADAE